VTSRISRDICHTKSNLIIWFVIMFTSSNVSYMHILHITAEFVCWHCKFYTNKAKFVHWFHSIICRNNLWSVWHGILPALGTVNHGALQFYITEFEILLDTHTLKINRYLPPQTELSAVLEDWLLDDDEVAVVWRLNTGSADDGLTEPLDAIVLPWTGAIWPVHMTTQQVLLHINHIHPNILVDQW